MLDANFRDFSRLHELAACCPQICCMSATIRPACLAFLAEKIGRSSFSESISISPERTSLALQLVVTPQVRTFIAENLQLQPQGQRAIVFCLYKINVEQTVQFLRSLSMGRDIFQCISGKSADCSAFNRSKSAIMVCTTVLAAGVSFSNVTRVYFQDGSHGPEVFLQGAGRGARADGEQCMAFLVTSKQQLNYFNDTLTCPQAATMATFCMKCFEEGLNFAHELYGLFLHDDIREAAGDKRSRTQQFFDKDISQSDVKPKSEEQSHETFQVN